MAPILDGTADTGSWQTSRLRAIPYELRVAILSAILLGEAMVYAALRGGL
jgi:hypothetical protein